MTSFFISYNKADRAWAEWIGGMLEEEGHSVIIDVWDFRPGGNFVLDMQRAASETDKTLMVLSEDYLKAEYTQPEWAAAFAEDPQSLERKVIPIRVRECQPVGMLRPIRYVELIGLGQQEARQAILDGLPNRGKPLIAPPFPSASRAKPTIAPQFPSANKKRTKPDESPAFPFSYYSSSQAPVDIPPNPFVPINGVVDQAERFFGREKELRSVFEILNGGSSVAIIGARQVG
ncbi:MAG: toll/interleukin-1 receptor domain-containing protein, partial [Elainellaceae cyanobacterium]